MQELSDENRQTIAANLMKVRQRIAAAADRSGRSPAEIRLMAVTKTQPPEVIPCLLGLGVDAIGESRPEIVTKKQSVLNCEVPWHMIGHYQRKKIKRTLPFLDMVHSIHSLELLSSLDHAAGELEEDSRPLDVLIQVNVSGEPQKQGFSPCDVPDVCDLAQAFDRLRLKGLMTMAPRNPQNFDSRDIFAALRHLRDGIGVKNAPELSMGMSQDFEVAVEEGATIVRIGSVLFDGLHLDR